MIVLGNISLNISAMVYQHNYGAITLITLDQKIYMLFSSNQ